MDFLEEKNSEKSLFPLHLGIQFILQTALLYLLLEANDNSQDGTVSLCAYATLFNHWASIY